MAGVLLLIDFGNDYWIYWSLNLQTHYVLYVLSLPLAASRRFVENFEYKRHVGHVSLRIRRMLKFWAYVLFVFPEPAEIPEKPKSKLLNSSFKVPKLAGEISTQHPRRLRRFHSSRASANSVLEMCRLLFNK